MSDSETELKIHAPVDTPRNTFRSSRFRTKRTRDACSSLKFSDIQDAKFLKGRDPAFVKQVADFAEVEVFLEGETLMQEGDEGNKMYFLHRGKVDVLVGADMKKVATLEAGAVVGELSLIGETKRSATIRAAEICDCRSLDKHTFARLLRYFPEERLSFHRLAERRLESLNQIRPASEQPQRRRSFLELPDAGLVEVKHFRRRRLSLSAPGCEADLSGRQSAPAVMDHATSSLSTLDHADEKTECLQDNEQLDPTKAEQRCEKVMQMLILPQLAASNRRSSCEASKRSSRLLPALGRSPDVKLPRSSCLAEKLRTFNCQLREEVVNLRQNLLAVAS
jgi:CRP-like cAMP-binding protein